MPDQVIWKLAEFSIARPQKMRRILVSVVLLVLLFGPAKAGRPAKEDANAAWQRLAAGIDLKFLKVGKPSPIGDSRIAVLRIDPALWNLELIGVKQNGESAGLSAREWCEKYNLAAAINAGMFEQDRKTHTGYSRFHEKIDSSRVNSYQSVAAFDPRDPRNPALFRIFDLDAPGITLPGILKDYASAIQNLRLIKRPNSNQWGKQNKKWSEAALGEDDAGRILFIFSRSPFSMHDLNQELLSAGIGLVAAQHLEGGPEAQLYLHFGKVESEMFGSYETSFREDDQNSAAWPIPNVLGIRPRFAVAH